MKFDAPSLEWRRLITDPESADQLDRVDMVIVDEAELVSSAGRGPRLELVIARCLRRLWGVAVALRPYPVQVVDAANATAISGLWPTGTTYG